MASLSPILGLLLLWPFVFDTALTFSAAVCGAAKTYWRRTARHLYQRLIIAGYSHRFVLLLYSGLAIIGAAAAIFWLRHPVPAFWCSVVILPSLAGLLYRFVVAQERQVQEAEDVPQILPFPSRKRRAA